MTNNNTSTRRERPIIFSAPMIRAILDGRKTQTRRIAKLTDAGHFLACRYGISGDRLWVRETWRPAAEFLSEGVGAKDIRYAASVREADYGLWKWRSPIFMPRRASRITLEITGVRIERLHAITSEDAESEGVQCDRSSWGFVDHYRELWKKINGTASWDANPWVWVVEFRRLNSGRTLGAP